MGIRPEDIQLQEHYSNDGAEGLCFEVLAGSTRLNGYQAVTGIETLDGSWFGLSLAHWKNRQPQPGTQLYAFLPAKELYFFDPATGKSI